MGNPCKGSSPFRDPMSIWRAMLCSLNGIIQSLKTGFEIPAHDEIAITYIGATNNIDTVVYKKDGATVATLTMSYAAAGAADDDLLTGVVKS